MTNQCFISVRDVQYTLLYDGYDIVVVTDIPCHLYMRWSLEPPQKHIVPRYLRGTYIHGDVYLCFVGYHDNEQEEAGDTLIHTFVKRPWAICETRYFHFWGTVAGNPCRSTSGVFELHFPGPALEIGHRAVPGTAGHQCVYTLINRGHPATGNGVITEIQIYIHDNTPGWPFYVGIFEPLGADFYRCRSAANIGELGYTPGYHTVAVSLACEQNDRIGIWGQYGLIQWRDCPDADGYCQARDTDNHCIVGDESLYRWCDLFPTRCIMLSGWG